MDRFINQIIHGDCLEVMKDVPDGSIDAVITDPPWGTTDLDFDKDISWYDQFLAETCRVLKDNGQFIQYNDPANLVYARKYFKKRWMSVWIKENFVMPFHNQKKPPSQVEFYACYCKLNIKTNTLIYNDVFRNGKPYIRTKNNRGYKRDGRDQLSRCNAAAWTSDGYTSVNNGKRIITQVLTGHKKQCLAFNERTKHPTQKPISDIMTLIKWITNENDLVLDPFLGSGTTAVACINTNRRYIGIEKNAEYHKIATDRVARALSQPKQLELVGV